MHSCQDIEENRYFSNGGTNLHIHAIAQGRPEDNHVEFIQGPHGIVNPPKNLVLNNIRRFTQMANGLYMQCVNPEMIFTARFFNGNVYGHGLGSRKMPDANLHTLGILHNLANHHI